MTELDEKVDNMEETSSQLIEALPKQCKSFRMFIMDYNWELILRETEK